MTERKRIYHHVLGVYTLNQSEKALKHAQEQHDILVKEGKQPNEDKKAPHVEIWVYLVDSEKE